MNELLNKNYNVKVLDNGTLLPYDAQQQLITQEVLLEILLIEQRFLSSHLKGDSFSLNLDAKTSGNGHSLITTDHIHHFSRTCESSLTIERKGFLWFPGKFFSEEKSLYKCSYCGLKFFATLKYEIDLAEV